MVQRKALRLLPLETQQTYILHVLQTRIRQIHTPKDITCINEQCLKTLAN